jgi:hypothetical protein
MAVGSLYLEVAAAHRGGAARKLSGSGRQ